MNEAELIQAAARKRAEVQAAQDAQAQAEKDFTTAQFQSIATVVTDAAAKLAALLDKLEPKVEVKNFPKPESDKEVVKAVKDLGKTLKPQKVDNGDVIAAIKLLNESIAKIPSLMPQTEAVKVTNLAELTKDIVSSNKALTAALNKLELSPKITVPKPTVTVQPTDVKGVIKELKNVAKEIVDKPVPGTTVVPTDPLIRFTPANMDDTTTVQYYSYIATDGEFYIRKVDKSGAYTTIRFYFGKGTAATHDTAWTNRAGLTYRMWTT